MEFSNLLLTVEDHIALLTFNRPKVLNAVNRETLAELAAAIEAVAVNPEVRALIVTGAGEKSFVAGADISEFLDQTPMTARDYAAKGQITLSRLEGLPFPVIGAINGFALGGGCEISLACHVRLASENARFGLPEVTLGIIPGFGGTQRLPRLIGKGPALELILSGKHVDAQEAHRLGLVNKVVPLASLLDEAKALAKSMIKNGPVALRLALEAVSHGLNGTLEEGLSVEAQLFGLVASTQDMKEGASAFLEKRKAEFKGW